MSRSTNTLVPRNHEFPNVNMAGQSFAHFGDVYNLTHSSSSQEQQAGLKRNELLTALAFEAMNARHMQLAQISVESLEWIWHTTEEDGPGFVEWLTSEGTTFWITGKPASGKSALMNFLASSNNCENILQKHSGHAWLLLDFYFDFRAGSQTANSLEGLLRSLLFQFVQKNTTAATVVQEDPVGHDLHIKHNDMDTNALCRLIKIAAAAVSDTHRILALIDGLDEYTGSYLHLIRMTERLVSNGINKICLASRPEHVLHQFLVGKPHFRMQDHNYGTIKAYVTHVVEQVSTMVELSMDTEELVDEIVRSSEGVILWTRIATETLFESLLGGDTEEEFQKKLRNFPTELSEAYERLLAGVSGPKRLETALILHLVRTAEHPLSPRDLHCMLVFLRDTDVLPSWPRQTIDDATFLLRLRARTGSLIDIVSVAYMPPFPVRHLHSSRIRLFHKTLDEYLTASNRISDIMSTASAPIQPDQLWLRSFVQCVLKYDLPQEKALSIWDWFEPLNPVYCTWDYEETFRKEPDLLFKDETTRKIARILSLRDNVDSGMDFLDCVIANLPTYLAQPVSTIPLEQSHIQQALGSLSMVLHVVMDRLRDSRGLSSWCWCAGWCNSHSFYSKKILFMLSSRQRAILFAMIHRDFRTACSWLSQEKSIPDQYFGRQVLNVAIFYYGFESFAGVSNGVLALVARYADDEIVTSLLPDRNLEFDVKLLASLAPYLAVNSGNRRLTKAWLAFHELNSIVSEGYNLYLPWATKPFSPRRLEDWKEKRLQEKKLQVIVSSGLDVNAVCCRFGPPLHTVVEVCLVLECRLDWSSHAIQRLNALRNVGADLLVLFEGLTAQDLARKRLQEVQADAYVPVTRFLNDFSKETAIETLQKIIACLETGFLVREVTTQEGATRVSHEVDLDSQK